MTENSLSLSFRLEEAKRELDKVDHELHTLIKSLGIAYDDYSFNSYDNVLLLFVSWSPPRKEQLEQLAVKGGFKSVDFKWTGGCA